jgi:hypothetical protein
MPDLFALLPLPLQFLREGVRLVSASSRREISMAKALNQRRPFCRRVCPVGGIRGPSVSFLLEGKDSSGRRRCVTYGLQISQRYYHLADLERVSFESPPRSDAHDGGLWRGSLSAGEPPASEAIWGLTRIMDEDQSRGSRSAKLKAFRETVDAVIKR